MYRPTGESEADIQRAIVRSLRHVGYRVDRIQAGRGRTNQQLAGAGLPDLFVVGYSRAAWLEVKTATGRTTPDQDAVHELLRAAGQTVAVVRSVDDALEVLRNA